ncbi:hypothetical protein M440DRAFT_219568 [Trichoderma longibrachiatum ATCC 18648]|uniref:Uncharacterized protein n=1 Tax=Trichoderma longibrachiatum ATCC 18648 TaxID=983965 RepID=A0A2T4BPR3_TRILO|nr:hypothetical protein M440DRAFT_219568 [Trichoderma longibrachiatum ATCC 18648]
MPQPQQHRTGQLPSRYASHLARLLDNSTVSSPYRTVLPELVDYVRRATALCCRVCKPRSSAVRLCGRTSDMPTPIEPPWSPPTSWPGALSADTPGSTQYVSVLNPWSLLFVLRRGSTPSFCLLKGCSTEVCPGMIVFIHLGTLRHQICFFPVHFKSKIPLLNPSSSLSRSINFSTASDLLIVSEEPLKPCPRRLSWPFSLPQLSPCCNHFPFGSGNPVFDWTRSGHLAHLQPYLTGVSILLTPESINHRRRKRSGTPRLFFFRSATHDELPHQLSAAACLLGRRRNSYTIYYGGSPT